MIEIIFYGRGGQGVVMASKTLAAAFFNIGKYVQAKIFPLYEAFDGERIVLNFSNQSDVTS